MYDTRDRTAQGHADWWDVKENKLVQLYRQAVR